MIWIRTGGGNEQRVLRPDGILVTASAGKCLDAVANGTANSTALDIWTCAGGANQKWSR